ILKLLVTLGIEGSNFKTDQYWNIILDRAPEFVDPFPDVTILEDVPGLRSITSFVSDNDDPADQLFFRFEGDSLVNIEKDEDLLRFTSKENWYGDARVTMFVTDSLAPEISKELHITVEPVNDAPVIDFSNYPLLTGDTLVLHHGETQSIDLDRIVSDVDDSLFTWTNSEDSRLDIEQSGDDLNISVSEDSSNFYGTISLELTVYDDEMASDSKNLNVQVKSYEPVISKINPLVMHADSTKEIDISEYVYDHDTPIEDLTFEFTAVDSTTRQIDENVNLDFNTGTKLLTITSTSGHSADNYIIVTVTDDDNNQTSQKVILLVVSSFAPKFVNVHPVVVYQDSTKEIKLDEIVFDVRDAFDDLILNIRGNDIFEDVRIDTESKLLIFESYPDEFGVDTLMLSAENTYGLTDSTEIIAYCIPDDNKPVIFDIPDLDLYWNMEYSWIDLDDYVFDAFTLDEELKWNISYSDDLFDLNIDNDNVATIETGNLTGIGKINLAVTNNLGLTSTKEIKVNITKDQQPVWDSFVDIFLVKTQPEKTMEWNIFDKCTDAETASEDLRFSASYESGVIDVDINSNTGEVVLSVIDTTKSETWLKFSARDENGNISESQLINIKIGDGLPPVWRNIPTIYIKNTEIFTGLKLLDYCRDPDDLESDLVFSAIPSNSNIKVEIDADTRVTITPENGIYGENFYIIFKAEDTQNNIVSTSVKLIITNALPPSGFVNYIVNPVLSKRVDFVVSTDSRVEEVSANFKKLPATNINLKFSQLTNNDDGIVWTDDHKFQEEGAYRLIVGMKDVSNFVTYDTLMMSVEFPDNNGAQVAMGNDTETMRLEYPEHHYNNKMFFITESNLSLDNNLLSKSIGHQDVYRKKYKIRSGIASEEILMTLRYKPKQFMDKYHSFYKVVDESLVPVETFINDEGEFIGYISEDCEICFGPSSMAAEEEILPENHFLTYPNPFNPTVNLKFILKAQKHVEMIVYNLRGQKVYSEQHYFNPGINEMAWHGINQKGEMMPSGVYFVLLQKNHKPMKIKKVTLFK
ncbi:MAG: gliding motility-associated C-terminal domain-containing protein, partial [Bacteroidota bacterium]